MYGSLIGSKRKNATNQITNLSILEPSRRDGRVRKIMENVQKQG